MTEINNVIKEGNADPKIYVNLGIMLKKMKRYQEAMNYFQKCLEDDPENFHAIYNGAALLFETGQYDLAESWFIGAKDSTMKFDER